jgi:hypothetical protein
LIPIAVDGLPRSEAYPRSIEEVLGAAVKTQRRAGSFLLDEHLSHHPISPEAGAATLLQGELGMVAGIEGLPWEIQTGSYLRVGDIPFPLRLARVSPPSPEERQALLAGPAKAMLEALHDIPRTPLQFVGTVDCSQQDCHREILPDRTEAKAGESQEVHVLIRDLAAGEVLQAKDTRPFRLVSSLLPQGFVPSIQVVTGAMAIQDLVPGEILVEDHLSRRALTAEPVKLYVPGLYPDWLHPGGRAYFLRAHAEAPPTPMDVLDMDRAPLGSPIPVECRPIRGLDWPKVHRGKGHKHDHGESGHEAWICILKR